MSVASIVEIERSGSDSRRDVAPAALPVGVDGGNSEIVARAARQTRHGVRRFGGRLNVRPRGVGRRLEALLEDVALRSIDRVPTEVYLAVAVASRGVERLWCRSRASRFVGLLKIHARAGHERLVAAADA